MQVRDLNDEIFLLQENSSHVSGYPRKIGKDRALANTSHKGKHLVQVDLISVRSGTRVALKSDSMVLHRILPTKVNPLVALILVEKVPDSTYEMIGGRGKQIKEVIELPIKHPELFENVGIAQPNGILLYGPPGQDTLSRAVAHHTDTKFVRVSGSELVQKHIGKIFVMARSISSSWTRSTPSAGRSAPAAGATARSNEQCSSSSTNSTASRQPTRSR
jgi:26S proteasome regulatory subunit T6